MQRFVPVARRKSPRLAFVAGVAATHAALVVIFLLNDTVRIPVHVAPPKEITLILRSLIPTPPSESVKVPRDKSNAITLPPLAPNETLMKLGRTLACRANYENLSPEERAHCAALPWIPADPSAGFMLGTEAPSIWAEALAERKAPFVSMFNPCDIGAIGPDAERSRLGLACVQTDPGQAKRWGKMLQ